MFMADQENEIDLLSSLICNTGRILLFTGKELLGSVCGAMMVTQS